MRASIKGPTIVHENVSSVIVTHLSIYWVSLFFLHSLLLSLFPNPSARMIPHFRRLSFKFGFQPFWELGPGDGQRTC